MQQKVSAMFILSQHKLPCTTLTPFFLNQFVEAAAKREAQLQAKKDADEKRRLAAEGE